MHRDEPWPRLPHFHDPDWLDAHVDDWDLVHFHFSWEQYPVSAFERVLERHVAHGTPVVGRAAVERAAGANVRLTSRGVAGPDRAERADHRGRRAGAALPVGRPLGTPGAGHRPGRPVLTTDVGHYDQQGPCRIVPVADGRVDLDRFRSAVREMATVSPPDPVPLGRRTAVLDWFRRVHAEVYGQVSRAARGRSGTAAS